MINNLCETHQFDTLASFDFLPFLLQREDWSNMWTGFIISNADQEKAQGQGVILSSPVRRQSNVFVKVQMSMLHLQSAYS